MYPDRLAILVIRYEQKLSTVPEEKVKERPSPDKWSIKELIGHLIDSASNNHQRFVRAQFTDDLIFDGYRQAEWVSIQDYTGKNWYSMLLLWKHFNLHLAHIMKLMPEESRLKERKEHNLDQIAWKKIPKEQSVTLDYFMEDYIEHLEHHLKQIDQILEG